MEILRVGLLIGEVHIKLPSHANDGADEPMLTVALLKRRWP
jgi:hypothetical protein